MRLIGYACRNASPPLQQTYLPLGPTTVLLGPNDAGKSSLLRSIVRDLAGGVAREHVRGTAGVFFLDLTRDELASVIQHARGEGPLSEGLLVDGPDPVRRPWSASDLELAEVYFPNQYDRDVVDTTAELLEHRRDGCEETAVEAIADALRDSGLVAVESAGVDGAMKRPLWNVYWCLPPRPELDARLREALAAAGVKPRGDGPRRGQRGVYEALYGSPHHLTIEDAPVPIVVLGTTRIDEMPRGFAVPSSFDALRGATAASVTDFVNVALRGLDDARRDEPFEPHEERAREAPAAWLVGTGEEARLSPLVGEACAFVAAAANRLLPSFVTSEYTVDVRPPDLVDLGAAHPIDIVLKRNGSHDRAFPAESLADGFVLWVQLAILDALEELGRVGSVLWDVAREEYLEQQAWPGVPLNELDDDNPGDVIVGDYHPFGFALEELAELRSGRKQWISDALERRMEELAPHEWTGSPARDRRFFVIDEPERHLHPRLQRAAASWLAITADTRKAPLLIATHAPMFLNLPSDSARHVRVERAADGAITRAFEPSDTAQLDDAAELMGYDRGELLTNVMVWLVVEGETDVAVLKTLFGPMLHRGGIAVVPIGGTAKWRAVVDSDALWRFTSAPVAVLFDGVPTAKVEELASLDADALEALTRSRGEPDGVRDIARVIAAALRQERIVHPLPSDPDDILGHLDDAAVRSVFERYPGHAAAEAAWQRHKKGSRDRFLKERYSLEKRADAFRRIAEQMLATALDAPDLRAAVERCTEIGREAATA